MAIQNFLSGGFYGSIGKLTGRRWKNKRVLQAKFSPKNPKTPAQELQRQLFTRGSALAKIGQQVNWNAIQFKNPIRTDWNQRQSVAIDALKNGKEEWEALPLAPTDFKAQHTIGVVTLGEITEDKQIKLVLQGTDLIADKKYSCAIFVNSGEKKGAIYVGTGATDAGSAENITLRFDEVEGIKGEECYVKIASIDDTEVDTVTLSAGVFLQQDVVLPYKFEPKATGKGYSSSFTLTLSVKIGNEAIESYDPWTNINIRLYDKAWTKETAVNSDTLDTDNSTDLNMQLTPTRTSVAKSTATVTFYFENLPLWLYEKFSAKLDISFDANNVKGVNSGPNSQTISLLAQSFPAEIQTQYRGPSPITLYANTTDTITVFGKNALVGQAFADEAHTEEYELLALNEDFEGEYLDDDGITSVTTTANKTYTGQTLKEWIGEQSAIPEISGSKIGWMLQEKEDLKSWQGSITGSLYCNGFMPKIALKGYKVYTIPEDEDGRIPISLKP